MLVAIVDDDRLQAEELAWMVRSSPLLCRISSESSNHVSAVHASGGYSYALTVVGETGGDMS